MTFSVVSTKAGAGVWNNLRPAKHTSLTDCLMHCPSSVWRFRYLWGVLRVMDAWNLDVEVGSPAVWPLTMQLLNASRVNSSSQIIVSMIYRSSEVFLDEKA